jgi:hypothetical protein
MIGMIGTGLSYLLHGPLWLMPIEFVLLAVLVMFVFARWIEIKGRIARNADNQQLASPTDLSTRTTKPKSPDEYTLEAFTKLLPNKGGIMQLRNKQFWSRFEWSLDELLAGFLREDAGPEHGFLDEQLESLRQELHGYVSLLLDRVHRYSEPPSSLTRGGGAEDRHFRFLSKGPNEDIARYDARRNELYEAAKNVCRIYDDLILTARRKLER